MHGNTCTFTYDYIFTFRLDSGIIVIGKKPPFGGVFILKLLKLISSILCVCLLSGCGNSNSVFGQAGFQDDSIKGMAGYAPEILYQIIPQGPNILVNQVGYQCSSTKVAIFRGDNLSDTFQIIDSDSEKIVYTGKIENKLFNEELNEYISYGTFSGFETQGNYYIQTDIIGQSYPFFIGKNLYYDIFVTTCKGFHESFISRTGQTYSKNIIMEDSQVIANLLLAYNLYPDLFGDDLDIPKSNNGIPDILDIIKYKIDWFQTIPTDKMSNNDLACYAGILAEFSENYKLYDNAYSNQCLKAAESAYQLLETVEINNDSLKYFAAVELYKATTYNKYHKVAKEYLNGENGIPGDSSFELYGNIAYLSGKSGIDTVLCAKIIANLMDKAEEISNLAGNNEYLVCSYDEEEILEEMQYLAIVDYVITNHEYVTVQENHLHYFLGRNPQGISYISEAGYISNREDSISITEQTNFSAQLIFMMCEILESENME